MRKYISIILILFCLSPAGECLGQDNPYYSENVRMIDSFVAAPMCQNMITYPTSYKIAKIKSDLPIIQFINLIAGNEVSPSQLDGQLKKFGRKKAFSRETTDEGLIKVREITLKGYYLYVKIKLKFIDNIIIRRELVIKTSTHGNCRENQYWVFDFKLGKTYFFKDLKLLLNVNFEEMVADTIYTNNLRSLAEQRKDYRFNIPGSSSEEWINEIFEGQYTENVGAYTYGRAPKDFVKLIKENKMTVITDLLYSPNYIISINAMESLLYLSSIGKISLSKEINERITQIKSGSFIFLQGAGDVYHTKKGYKDLQMTDEKVVKKYAMSM